MNFYQFVSIFLYQWVQTHFQFCIVHYIIAIVEVYAILIVVSGGPILMTIFKTLKLTKPYEHVLLITFNRPNVSNAFNTQMAWELIKILEDIAIKSREIRVVVLTGAGSKSFCAGGDLKERHGMSDEHWQEQHLVFERMIRAIIFCPLPTIGAINGAAFGGGCEIASALDFLYASHNAIFAQTEVRLGIIPGIGGTQTLARSIGEKRAKELIFTGQTFSSKDAYEWGLVNKIVPESELLDTALKVAKSIANNAPIAVKQAKQAIQKGLSMSLMDGLAFEIEAYNRTVKTFDRIEGVSAFNEKRKAKFRGD